MPSKAKKPIKMAASDSDDSDRSEAQASRSPPLWAYGLGVLGVAVAALQVAWMVQQRSAPEERASSAKLGAENPPAKAFLQTGSTPPAESTLAPTTTSMPTATSAPSREAPAPGSAAGSEARSVSAKDLEKFASSGEQFSIQYEGYTGYHGLCNPGGMYFPYQTVVLPTIADALHECSIQAKCGAFSTSSQLGGYTVSFWTHTTPVQHGSAAAGDTSGTCFIHSGHLNAGYKFHQDIAKKEASADVTVIHSYD